MIRILHVLGTTNLGGAESRIMDLYRQMDRERIQFDFVCHTCEKGYFDDEIEKLGGHIYRMSRFKAYNYFSYKKAWKQFFLKHHEFQAVQGHMTSTASIYLPLAKAAGIPMTIAHARSAGVDQGLKGKLTRLLRRKLAKKADYLFACSELAGTAVFGAKAMKEGRVTFIPNAIDARKFIYNPETRNRMREELGIADKLVIGHVGRFHYAKNHEYLLRIFADILAKNENAVLLLLGEGPGMENSKLLAKELEIEKQVRFLGNHANVWDYYQAMDFFLYPSRYEGLPGTVVEAQAAGLRCLMSDTIAGEVVLSNLVESMSIQEDTQRWADRVLSRLPYRRENQYERIAASGFDCPSQAEKLERFYETGSIEEIL